MGRAGVATVGELQFYATEGVKWTHVTRERTTQRGSPCERVCVLIVFGSDGVAISANEQWDHELASQR